VGGTELYTQAIGHAMAERGHEIGILYRSDSPSTELGFRRDAERVSVWAASAGPMSPGARFLASYRNPTLQSAFERVLNAFRPELVHIQHMMGLPAAFGRILQARRIPYVITLWDFWWRCANAQLLTNYSREICSGPSAAFLNCAHCAVARAGHPHLLPALPLVAPVMAARNAALQPVIDGAARLIAPTEFVRRWYVQHGFPTGKTLVLAPALRYPDPLPGAEGASKPASGTQPGGRPFRVAYIGGLSSQKGVHVLIEAFAGLRGDAELWIAGDETADPD
jgi:glycosyltransferase involved in cell wall biosynthesis